NAQLTAANTRIQKRRHTVVLLQFCARQARDAGMWCTLASDAPTMCTTLPSPSERSHAVGAAATWHSYCVNQGITVKRSRNEADHSHHQAVQAGRGTRGAVCNGHTGHDRYRGQGIWTSKGPHGAISGG